MSPNKMVSTTNNRLHKKHELLRINYDTKIIKSLFEEVNSWFLRIPFAVPLEAYLRDGS